MDSRFLQSFVSVVESGSIAEAARRLDLSAATIAQRLRVLETEIGRQLIVRSGRTVKPTVAGTRILERARSVLREVRDMESAATETDLPAGPLRLGAMPTGLTGIVPVVLKDWVRAYPQISLYIEPASTTVLYGRLLAGDLDAAVLVHPMFALPKTCAWVPLRREALVLLAPAGMKVRDALETIRREPFIRYDRQVIAGKMADDYLRQHGIRPRLRVELDGIEYIAKFVAEGLGVSVLPDWAVIGPANPAVRRWPLPAPVPTREVGVVWQRSTAHAPLVDAFVALAQRHYRVP
ncbi:MAG: LysR family transcriptional regulator [Sphaerotilus sp.]|nr:LysR family transcriptional regulator [Sphaerotilus sp.]